MSHFDALETQDMLKFRVVLDKAESLAAADKTGTSDPYVKLKIGHSKKGEFTSKVVWKTLFPVWGEECILYCSPGEDDLSISVYDSDGKLSKDDYLGGAMVRRLSGFCESTTDNRVSPNLERLKKDDKLQKQIKFIGDSAESALGKVFLKIYALPSDEKITPRKSTFGHQTMANTTEGEEGKVVRINLISAANLLGITKQPIQLKQNEVAVISQLQPMCEITMSKKKGKVMKKSSKICKKTIHPEFKQGWELPMNDDYSVITFSIWDKGNKNNDNLIGRAWIDASDEEYIHNQFIEKTLTLWSGEGDDGMAKAGQLRVAITVETMVLQEFGETTMSSLPGRLKVDIVRARKLAAMDFGGTSDPFCVVEVDNRRRRTGVQKKTLNPYWDRSCTFQVFDIFGDLTVKVFDDDGGDDKDDFMGMVVIPLDLITNSGKPEWYALKDMDGVGRAKGEIELEISFELFSVKNSLQYVLQHRKEDFVDGNSKWKIKHLTATIARLTSSIKAITDVVIVLDKLRKWEYGIVSSLLFVGLYIPFVLLFELWMVPCMGLMLMGTTYAFHNQSSEAAKARRIYPVDADLDGDSDSDEEDDKGDKPKKGIYGKYKLIVQLGQQVQDITDVIADVLERIKNLLNWTVPALTQLVVIVLAAAALVLYLIPIKYFILIIGVAVFAAGFKKKFLSKPNKKKKVPLIVDLLSRVPSDMDLSRQRRLQSQEPSRSEMARKAAVA